MRSPLTTLCYVEQDGKYLMLHRISKKNDVNKDKWIGIGGHFEEGESPEECLLREAKEETGLTLTSWKFRGIVTFIEDEWPPEYMCLYTADGFEGTMIPCNEGKLEWVPKTELTKLNLWEGDKIFLKLLAEDAPFFSMKLRYEGDILKEASLEGKPLELFDICDEQGVPTGKVTERSVAHASGLPHRTVHIWVVRKNENGAWEILLQKRSAQKESFPLCYDTSAAGHVGAGDSYEASAYRELQEELGISAMPEELDYIGTYYKEDLERQFHGKPFLNKEASAVYVYQGNVDETQLQLQKEEVDSVRWLDYQTCRKLVEQNDPRFCADKEDLDLLDNYLGKQHFC